MGRTVKSVGIIIEFYVIVDNLMVSGVSWDLVLKVFGLLVVCCDQVSRLLSDFGNRNRATRVWPYVEWSGNQLFNLLILIPIWNLRYKKGQNSWLLSCIFQFYVRIKLTTQYQIFQLYRNPIIFKVLTKWATKNKYQRTGHNLMEELLICYNYCEVTFRSLFIFIM